MEAKDVYMTTAQVEDLREKVNAIEGVAEIKAAIRAWSNYHQAKMELERGDRFIEDMPAYNPDELSDLRKKYPRAAAFLEAERWVSSGNPIEVRLGSRAMEKILNGEDYTAVLEDMKRGMEAFYMAQEG